jgi:hypothetical protein
MNGSANFAIRTGGSALWTGGGLGGSAGTVLRIPAGVALNIAGTATKAFTGRTIRLESNASATWSLGNVSAIAGATLEVQPNAVFNVSAVASWFGSGTPVPVIHISDRANMNVTTSGTTSLPVGLVFNNQGTLDIAAGATLKVGADLNQLALSTLQGRGVLDVVGNSKVVNQGTVRPGTSPGVLTILGNWPQGLGSTLVIEIFGPAPDTGHDRLVVSGQLTSGGALQLVGNGTYQPRTITLQLVTYGSRVGPTFSVSLLGGLTGLQGLNYSLTDFQTVW